MALPDTSTWDADDAPAPRFVRPYTLTAGRMKSRVDLPMEATLRHESVSAGAGPDGLIGRILDVCDTKSVAEVSALVQMPIGVVRVLLGDLVDLGYVRVQATLTDGSSYDARRDLIERTLRGLRSL